MCIVSISLEVVLKMSVQQHVRPNILSFPKKTYHGVVGCQHTCTWGGGDWDITSPLPMGEQIAHYAYVEFCDVNYP